MTTACVFGCALVWATIVRMLVVCSGALEVRTLAVWLGYGLEKDRG
jgi:hypothetical protein